VQEVGTLFDNSSQVVPNHKHKEVSHILLLEFSAVQRFSLSYIENINLDIIENKEKQTYFQVLL
jgi:hypothetical protein